MQRHRLFRLRGNNPWWKPPTLHPTSAPCEQSAERPWVAVGNPRLSLCLSIAGGYTHPKETVIHKELSIAYTAKLSCVKECLSGKFENGYCAAPLFPSPLSVGVSSCHRLSGTALWRVALLRNCSYASHSTKRLTINDLYLLLSISVLTTPRTRTHTHARTHKEKKKTRSERRSRLPLMSLL